MEINTPPVFQKVDNLEVFLSERGAIKRKLNKEIEIFKKKLAGKTFPVETLLFSASFTKTLVTLNNEAGVLLREVTVSHTEHLSNFEYLNNIIIRFNCGKERLKSYLSLSRVGFDDKEFRIGEQVIPIGLNIQFVDQQKYEEVKTVIKEMMGRMEKVKK